MSEKEALQRQMIDPGLGAINVRDSFLDVTLGLVGIKDQWSMEKAKKKLSHAVEQLLRAARGELRLAPQGLDWGESKQRGKTFEYVGATLEKVDPHSEHVITKKWIQDHLRGFKTNFRRGSWVLARFPEGEPVDVPTYLKEHGNPEAADRWTVMHEQHKDKFKSQPDAPNAPDREAKTMSAMDELKKLATWETGHVDEDADLPEGEGSLIPGLEERRGSFVFAYLVPDDDMNEAEVVAIDGDEIMGRFEEGKPADPCENMSEAECDEWNANTEKYKDKFDKGAMADLERMASTEKQAINQVTKDFIEWAVNQPVMSQNEVIRALKRAGLKEILPPIKREKGKPRFAVGDDVYVRADKHPSSADTYEIYKENDGKVGVVVGVEGMAVFVQFKSGQPVQFPDGMKPRGIGLYKYTPAFVMQGSKKIEIIYFAGGKPTKDQQVAVQQYMGRGRSVAKSANYYTGHAFSARYAKDGTVYFQLFPQQRRQVDPQKGPSEAGYAVRSFNPSKGQVHYLGIFGKRPRGWEQELDDMRAGSMVMASMGALERLAGSVLGPGVPDGTGPHSGTPDCQMAGLEDPDGSELPGDEMLGRFEEGKPADPCENMTDEECEEWRNNTEKYKDKFDKDKSASMGKTAGYTNYWKIKEPFTPDEWNVIKLAAAKAWDQGRRMKKIPPKSPVWDKAFAGYVAENGVVLKGQNGSGRPEITDEFIAFNGDGSARIDVEIESVGGRTFPYSTDLAHEDFFFENKKGGGFCKTERKPYDMAVASVLWWAKKTAPKKIDVSTDDGRPVKIWASDKQAVAEVNRVEDGPFNYILYEDRGRGEIAVSSMGRFIYDRDWDARGDRERVMAQARKLLGLPRNWKDGDRIPSSAKVAFDKQAAEIADVSERAFNWFSEVGKKFDSLPWEKAIDGLGRAISNKGRAEDVLDDFTDLDKAKMNSMLSKGGEKKLKKWLKDTFQKRGSMDEVPARKRMTARKQMLLPKNIRSKIPKLYSQEDNPDPIAWVKFFNAYGRGTWLITEFDGRDTMFGLADLGFPELGYVSLSELESLEKMPGLQQIERDTSFRPMPLSEAAKKNGIRWSPPRTASKREGEKKNWIPKDLEKGRCTPGSPNYDCPEGSPQYNLAQTFKKHPEWGEKGGKHAARDRMTQREAKSQSPVMELLELPHMGYETGGWIRVNDMTRHFQSKEQLQAEIKKLARRGLIKVSPDGRRIKKLALQRTAAREPGGLYGFPKKIQADCESASRKLAKAAITTAKAAYRKDERVARFLATHAERSGSLSAQILVKAMQEIGPKVAAEIKKQARLAELRAERGVEAAEKPEKVEGKTAGNAKYGLYGFKAKTADLGLKSCNAIRREAGRIASDLHGRRAEKHARITEFLRNRSKRGRCLYSRMLVRSYPDAEMKVASVKPASVNEWLAWED